MYESCEIKVPTNVSSFTVSLPLSFCSSSYFLSSSNTNIKHGHNLVFAAESHSRFSGKQPVAIWVILSEVMNRFPSFTKTQHDDLTRLALVWSPEDVCTHNSFPEPPRKEARLAAIAAVSAGELRDEAG